MTRPAACLSGFALSSSISADTEMARVVVKDNGPGMSIETLEHALKAGWTGNNPLSALGLFGMGFNIATARVRVAEAVERMQAAFADLQ